MSKKLPVLDALATFVDVGSEHMHVSVGGGAPEVFGTVTSQLHALRDRLLAQHVRSVAMEATGVYWLALYGVLEAAGLQVRMVNGRQTRNLPGRKTDMVDCQWGATPHMHGLLRAGFVPPADIRRLQDYLRLRADHVGAAGGCVQLMQKALERMNIKLHGVIASLAGTSGLAVVRAVVAGDARSAARHLGLRACLRTEPGAAVVGALPAPHRRMRRAHRRGAASLLRDTAAAGQDSQARRCQRPPTSWRLASAADFSPLSKPFEAALCGPGASLRQRPHGFFPALHAPYAHTYH